MFITVGGVPGSGKTTITNKIVQIGTALGLPVERVKGSDIMCNLAGVSSVDELRELPESVRAKLRPKMFETMYEADRADPNTIRIRDMHYSFPDGQGSFIALPPQNGDKEQLLLMVLLNPPIELVSKRRQDDKNIRNDRNVDPSILRQELEFEKHTAVSNAKITSTQLIICENDTDPEETATFILEKLITLRSEEGQPRSIKEKI